MSSEQQEEIQAKKALDKKKLKVLKMALKEERANRSTIEKELQAAYEKIELVKTQFNDKEQQYLKLYQENINLQEALVRESKSTAAPKTKSSGGTNKPPALVGSHSKKESTQEKESNRGSISSESMELLNNKCKSLEELILKKDQENSQLLKKIEELEAQQINISNIFEEKYREIVNERDLALEALKQKEEDFSIKKREIQEQAQKQKDDLSGRIEKLEVENKELETQRNDEMDKNLKTGELMDEKNDKINQLEKELQRKIDESNLRKEVIDSLSESLMKHEGESRDLASKLVLMKNQILENDVGKSLARKYAAVKIGQLKNFIPVSVRDSSCINQIQIEFVQERNNDYFLFIESRQNETQISFESLDSMTETKDGRLNIIYFVSSGDGSNFTKKSEMFDCFEINTVLKTYQSIRNIQETADSQGMRMTKSFMGTTQFAKQKSLSPMKKNRAHLLF